MTHERDGGLVGEASQELKLAFEGGRSVRSAGHRDHERCGEPGCVNRGGLVEELLVVASIWAIALWASGSEPSERSSSTRAARSYSRGPRHAVSRSCQIG